jgi:hypothetical protein
MAKKKMPKKKLAHKKTKARKPAARKAARQPLVTAFMRNFRAFLKSQGWPHGQALDSAMSDTAGVVGMLGHALATGAPPPAPTTLATFLDRATAHVHDYGWPANPEYLKKWPTRMTNVHLWEIDRIADAMLAAANGGMGGGGSSWPPHR